MLDVRLSPHFSLSEFTASETAARLGIDNSLPESLMPVARETAAMLERLRDKLRVLANREVPVGLSSGYRCLALNRALRSADNSDHPLAQAADLTARGFGTPTQICQALAPLIGELGIGQLINEYPDRNGWVHVSTRRPANAVNRVITITGRGTFPGVLTG